MQRKYFERGKKISESSETQTDCVMCKFGKRLSNVFESEKFKRRKQKNTDIQKADANHKMANGHLNSNAFVINKINLSKLTNFISMYLYLKQLKIVRL